MWPHLCFFRDPSYTARIILYTRCWAQTGRCLLHLCRCPGSVTQTWGFKLRWKTCERGLSLKSASSDTYCSHSGDVEDTKKKVVAHYANAAGELGNMKMELGKHEPLKVIGDLNKSHFDALVWAEAKGSGENRGKLETTNMHM